MNEPTKAKAIYLGTITVEVDSGVNEDFPNAVLIQFENVDVFREMTGRGWPALIEVEALWGKSE